jgi:glutamate synthase domain-containing protein 1/glutamate synthase domain-containing protein 3
MKDRIERLLLSRKSLADGLALPPGVMKGEEEGGCGVVGLCCSEPVAARHIYEPSKQMHNRGNGKGGGIAAVGFIPEQLGVSREVLDSYYMLHIAFLDEAVRPELERKYIIPHFDIAKAQKLDSLADWTAVPDLEVKPPAVWRYFIRVKKAILDDFISKSNLAGVSRDEAEDEFINQNSFRLNQEFYASLGEQKAFVLSEGKDIMILKVVGYAEAITKYYKIDDLKAHIWIAHQRFPTKGRVWHPGGAHPFGAINTALVHNGDFANYHSVCEYLAQRHIYPQFLTDTEVSVQLFDLLSRTYEYPLEYIIEALAPTSEMDFDRLPAEKQPAYRAIQAAHIHGSPDGPWFFIIARNMPAARQLQLMGITDTAMLRPQVFAFADGEVQVGLICSEKQAIDATLLSLSRDDSRICPVADRYWNARGGSYTDGGAFIFTLARESSGKMRLECSDKFGHKVPLPASKEVCDFTAPVRSMNGDLERGIKQSLEASDGRLYEYMRDRLPAWSFDELRSAFAIVTALAGEAGHTTAVIESLTMLHDRPGDAGAKKRSHVIYIIRQALSRIFSSLPRLAAAAGGEYRLADFATRHDLRPPREGETTMVIDSRGFAPEGPDCDATLIVDAYMQGWRHFISYNLSGQRFHGCGLGPATEGVTIDLYDSSGDYLGSGIDGLTIIVHGNAQDQLGQIIKNGKLVVHGDVGQTFMYGAKGGSVFVRGNAAGRPLINSVGRPRVVINGTCLDFLGESFMAGDVFNDGGFVVLNGVAFDDAGRMVPLAEPYAGSNLFSLASGGALYIRDPGKRVVTQQLNGGMFAPLTGKDWELIQPYLEENERLFGIKKDELLVVDGVKRAPDEVYRKVTPARLAALSAVKAALPEEEDEDDD